VFGPIVTLSATAVGNEQMFFIVGKGQAIGVVKVIGDLRHFKGVRIDAVDMATILLDVVNFAFVVGDDAVVGVSEPNGMV
jgi:predicted RNA-binding protein